MHKPLWSYIFSAGRFLSFDITRDVVYTSLILPGKSVSSPPRTWTTVIPPVIRIPLRRVRIHVQPPAIRTEFPLVCIYTYNYDLSDLASGDV